ncbi:MAG: isochorismatase [Chloroflexota bacterium]
MPSHELPLPPFFETDKVGEVWRVPYADRANEAIRWANEHHIQPAATDTKRVCLLLVDVQNTFCIPGFELFVGGRSGMGAVEDNRRLCEFIYHNLGVITEITPTMDTHQPIQIFHSIFLVDEEGKHPDPHSLITVEDIEAGRWKFNPLVAQSLHIDAVYGQQHLLHYTRQLKTYGKYELTIWPYHAMLGGIGHALVSSIEEAIFFHSVARYCQPDFLVKGNNPLTEHYSAVGPEVLEGPDGRAIAQKNGKFMEKLKYFDAVVIAGQAQSHCVAWTINDLLEDIRMEDEDLVRKVYLLEDCTSPVVVPGVVDYTEQAEAAFNRFVQAGMHIVRSTEPITGWQAVKDG